VVQNKWWANFSVQMVKVRGYGKGYVPIGGRPHSMSALGRRIFLAFYEA